MEYLYNKNAQAFIGCTFLFVSMFLQLYFNLTSYSTESSEGTSHNKVKATPNRRSSKAEHVTQTGLFSSSVLIVYVLTKKLLYFNVLADTVGLLCWS